MKWGRISSPDGEYRLYRESFSPGRVVYLDYFHLYSVEILAGLFAAFTLFFGVALLRLNQKLKGYSQLTKLMKGGSLEELILELDKRTQENARESIKTADKLKGMGLELSKKPHNWSLIRFNAFGSTGGDLSFALAMVNDDGDGYILSSIYGREESRMYAKPLRGGKSSYKLSEEEKQAIKSAIQGSI